MAIKKTWSEEDHLRHFLYESVYGELSKIKWEDKIYNILDFGSKWFGDPDGGWQTYMRWMFKDLIGNDRLNHILGTYPEYNAENLDNVESNSIDVVVADQVLEHVQKPWLASEAFYRVLKPSGIAIIATPGLYPVHPSPLDCWRIMPDGYKVLFPSEIWETLVFDTWGSANRVAYEYTYNKELLKGGRTYTVSEAMKQPYYLEKDGLCPMQLWWVGRKI
jgi:SAM-dependent methyltransferase